MGVFTSLLERIESFVEQGTHDYVIDSTDGLHYLESTLAVYGRGSISPKARNRIMDTIGGAIDIADENALGKKAEYVARKFFELEATRPNVFPVKVIIHGMKPDGTYKYIKVVNANDGREA